MALHPCPRCKRLIPVGVVYCEDCRPLAEAQASEARERRQAHKRAEYNRQYNIRRDPKYLAFYRSKEWKLLSRTKLQACGYRCELRFEGCTGLAVEVDHTVAIQTPEGWDRRFDWDNLRGTCINCHNQKHKRWEAKPDPGVIDIKKLFNTPQGWVKKFSSSGE